MGMSKDEIDRLMAESADGDNVYNNAGDLSGPESQLFANFGSLYADAFKNIVPILVGAGDCEISLESPVPFKLTDLLSTSPSDNVYFSFEFPALMHNPMVGTLSFSLALDIAKKMMGQDDAESLNDALLSALVEAFNNVLGAFDSSLTDSFNITVEHANLTFIEKNSAAKLSEKTGISGDTDIILLPMNVVCEDQSGQMGLFLTLNELKQLYVKHPSSKTKPKPQEPKMEPTPEPEISVYNEDSDFPEMKTHEKKIIQTGSSCYRHLHCRF